MIKINGKSYKLKFTLRAMMIYEQITKKPFSLSTITDEYVYLYCMIMANNPEANLTFEDLIDALDEDPTIMIQFRNILEDYTKKQQLFKDDENEESADKKKV